MSSPSQLDFSRVQAGAQPEPERRRLGEDGASALDAARETVEGGEEAVAGGLHLMPAEPLERAAHHLVVLLEQLAPTCGGRRQSAATR